MAANEETVSIDTVKKTLWDSLEALGENISGETLETLLEIIDGGGSGGGLVYVPFVISENPETGGFHVETTASYSDVVDAVNGNKLVVGIATGLGEFAFLLSLTTAVPSVASPTMLVFNGVTDTSSTPGGNQQPSMMTIWFSNDGLCMVSMVGLSVQE